MMEGELPVDVLEISEITFLSSEQVDGKDGAKKLPNPQNAFVPLLAPSLGEGEWTKKADMPTARGMFATSAAGGKIYAIGGIKAFPDGISTVEEYDPVADKWTRKANMPTARNYLSNSVVNGKIYAIGGWNWSVLSTVEEYNPVTDKWSKKTDMPTPREVSTSVVNGKIYAIGGWNGVALSTVEEYDPAADTWTKKTDMPTARWGHSTSVVHGKIYAIGGRVGTWNQGPAFSIVEEYDPVADTWTEKTDMPTARWGLSTSVVHGKIYAIGGSQDESTALSTVEEYDPVTDTWTKKASMPTARWYLSTNAVNGKIYVVGGATAAWVFTSTVEEYDLESTDQSINTAEKLTTTWGRVKSGK
jgi:N-acetylneuraminic acid mutarotase